MTMSDVDANGTIEKLTESVESAHAELKAALKARDEDLAQFKDGISTENEKRFKSAEAKFLQAVEDREEKMAAITSEMAAMKEDRDAQKRQYAELKAQLDQLQLSGQMAGGTFPGANAEELKTPGQMFVENPEVVSELSRIGKANYSCHCDRFPEVNVKSFFSDWPSVEQKTTLTLGSSGPATWQVPFRDQPVIPVMRPLSIRDLIPSVPIAQMKAEFVKLTTFGDTATSTGTIAPEDVAEPVAEVTAVNEAKFIYSLVDEDVREIGTFLPTSRRALDNVAGIRADIDTLLRYGVLYKEEVQLLYGDNTGQNLNGLMTQAGQSLSWSAGEVGDTEIDCIRKAMTLSHIAFFQPSGIVMHPTNWQNVELVKATTGQYVWLNVSAGNVERLFRVPVVVTTAITENSVLVGSFAQAAKIWDRQSANITMSDSHEEYFVKRMVAIMATEMLALGVIHDNAFVDVTLDEAPS
jgi:HK97 family phage major capsid protein